MFGLIYTAGRRSSVDRPSRALARNPRHRVRRAGPVRQTHQTKSLACARAVSTNIARRHLLLPLLLPLPERHVDRFTQRLHKILRSELLLNSSRALTLRHALKIVRQAAVSHQRHHLGHVSVDGSRRRHDRLYLPAHIIDVPVRQDLHSEPAVSQLYRNDHLPPLSDDVRGVPQVWLPSLIKAPATRDS